MSKPIKTWQMYMPGRVVPIWEQKLKDALIAEGHTPEEIEAAGPALRQMAVDAYKQWIDQNNAEVSRAAGQWSANHQTKQKEAKRVSEGEAHRRLVEEQLRADVDHYHTRALRAEQELGDLQDWLHKGGPGKAGPGRGHS
jgi:hypothetical protein